MRLKNFSGNCKANVENDFRFHQDLLFKVEKKFGCNSGTAGFKGFSEFCGQLGEPAIKILILKNHFSDRFFPQTLCRKIKSFCAFVQKIHLFQIK